jgi:hypothetical protein
MRTSFVFVCRTPFDFQVGAILSLGGSGSGVNILSFERIFVAVGVSPLVVFLFQS